ncbi:FAD/NAD(P)-binding domain-containing protein [Brachybacterium sp. EE-P12]|uniref:FAD/NAD(P)-binding protein n=1 Tax=Candidatus Brachybacterium intestinipullorum TaxID=2838512 RepID=A0A9D2TJI0_9MICO|nr:FAD/NAD(P)-binding protein [Brachybacterium sp. EE-P12]HJC70782.1 FAD/NAD(P)-binding protein [Candidatus Brachybacterium intestinipullorum]
MSEETFDAVIVGGGPRGVATVLRLAARARVQGAAPVRVAIVDALAVGPGATWLVDQPAEYLNNTQADATTVHPDESTPMSGPPAPGPDLVDWARRVRAEGSHPVGEWVLEEARELTGATFPTRRLQGVYFRDQLEAAVATGAVELTEVLGLAVDLETRGEERTVVLEGGRRLTARTVVLAQGMVQGRRSAEVQELVEFAQRRGLRYVEPGMPAERDYTALPAGEDVLVRGLGANFFDVVGQLAAEWGGRLDPVDGDPHGRLRYLPSGREPHLVVGSRRGVPYRSKPEGGRPVRPFTPRWAIPEWFDALAARGRVDFAAEVWPVLGREFARVHLEAVAALAPEAVTGDWLAGLDAARTAEEVDAVLEASLRDEAWAWTLEELHRPTLGEPVGEDGWARLVRRMIRDELGSMSDPWHHPRAAVNGAMGALRRHVGRLTARGAFTGESLVRDVLGWFDGDSLALASGPPADRVRLVLALLEAGVITLLGPGMVVEADEQAGRFRAASPITGAVVTSRVLLETRMSKGKVPDTDDPLLRALLDTGRARVHTVDGVPTHSMEASPAEISEDAEGGHNLVAADGTIDAAVVVLGIPAQSTQPGSAIGATPGVPSPLLAGADIAARQVMARARVTAVV